MQIKPWLKLFKPLIQFIILATASLILTLTVADILSATPANETSPPTPLLQGEGSLTPPFPRREGGLGGLGFSGDDLNNQGRQQLEIGDAQAALTSWKEAELAYRKANNDEGIIGSQINQAQAMQALGQYRQAEKLLEEINKFIETKADSELKIVALRSYGDILRLTGELKKSEEVLTKSLNLAELQYPENIEEIKLSLGNTAFAKANRAKAVNDNKAAQMESQKALDFYKYAANDDTLTATKLQAQLNSLRLLIDNNEYLKAGNLWPEIRDTIARYPMNRLAIEARINLADSLIEIKKNYAQTSLDWQNISQILATALQQAKKLQDWRSQSYALGKLGSLYEAAKQYSDALEITKEALSIAQAINTPDIAYQWQWQLGRLYNNLGEKESAIASYTTAVNTLDAVRQNLAGIDPEAQFSFRDDVEPVYRELVDLLLQPEPGENEPNQENLKSARQVIESLQLAEIENFFREACLEAKPEQIDEIVDKYDRTAAVIYPIILRDRIEVILKLPEKPLDHSVTRIDQSQVEATVKELRGYLKEPDRAKKVRELSMQVYEWLIKPFEKDLENIAKLEKNQIKTLVFVLDGELQNIPMAALYDGKQYLIERYAIALTSGLQLLDTKPIVQGKIDGLIAGVTDAPSFKKEGFGSLANVKEELDEVAKIIHSSREISENKFTVINFQNQLELATYSIVHLATHGKFSSDPDRTFILAWDGRMNIKELDNLLRLSDRNGSNTIELLALSACQTALGDKRAALGLAGVAARAGTRSTVASLWQVYDRSTAKLMIEFYKQLFANSNKVSKAEALRQAQLSLLNNPSYRVPYYWSAFILLGNWF